MRKANLTDSMDIFNLLWIVFTALYTSFMLWIKHLPETIDMIFNNFLFGLVILGFWLVLLFLASWQIKKMLNLVGELYFDKLGEKIEKNDKRNT